MDRLLGRVRARVAAPTRRARRSIGRLGQEEDWRDDRGSHIRTRGPEDIARCPYDVAIVPPRLAADERESLSERRWGTVVLEGAAASECKARVVVRCGARRTEVSV